jgi:hypothetical protein
MLVNDVNGMFDGRGKSGENIVAIAILSHHGGSRANWQWSRRNLAVEIANLGLVKTNGKGVIVTHLLQLVGKRVKFMTLTRLQQNLLCDGRTCIVKLPAKAMDGINMGVIKCD